METFPKSLILFSLFGPAHNTYEISYFFWNWNLIFQTFIQFASQTFISIASSSLKISTIFQESFTFHLHKILHFRNFTSLLYFRVLVQVNDEQLLQRDSILLVKVCSTSIVSHRLKRFVCESVVNLKFRSRALFCAFETVSQWRFSFSVLQLLISIIP